MISKRQLFLNHVAQTSPSPMALNIVDSSGIFLFDEKGERYIDLISGIGVSSLGHRNHKVVDACKQQLDKYLHTMVYGEFVLSPQVKLAEKLSNCLPLNLNSTYFVNSGSEAVEGAIKLARKYTKRWKIIAARKSYHGSTYGAMALQSETIFTAPFEPQMPGVDFVDFNNEDDFRLINKETAAVIVETVQGEAGVIVPEKSYLKNLKRHCEAVGALLILDEIQTGYGRTGSLFAFEQFDLAPDILLLAKAMGGGMPIGAFISSKEIMDCLSNNPILGHITTFGGHPVSCAAGLATLEVLTSSNYIKNVDDKAKLFKFYLKHKAIKSIRNAGLMMAVQLDTTAHTIAVAEECIKNGVIVDWFLFNTTSIRIAPPLIITEGQIMEACKIILKALDKIYV